MTSEMLLVADGIKCFFSFSMTERCTLAGVLIVPPLSWSGFK